MRTMAGMPACWNALEDLRELPAHASVPLGVEKGHAGQDLLGLDGERGGRVGAPEAVVEQRRDIVEAGLFRDLLPGGGRQPGDRGGQGRAIRAGEAGEQVADGLVHLA